jgi:hypothetical protein
MLRRIAALPLATGWERLRAILNRNRESKMEIPDQSCGLSASGWPC